METLLPWAGGHVCGALARGKRGARCQCHVRKEICIGRRFAPWDPGPFPSACQYVGMTLRQMSFYLLAKHASPCVPWRGMALSPLSRLRPQGCPHVVVIGFPGQSQWAVQHLLGEPHSGSRGAAYHHPCSHRKGVTTERLGACMTQEMVISSCQSPAHTDTGFNTGAHPDGPGQVNYGPKTGRLAQGT